MPTKYEFEQIITKLEEAINFFKKSQYRFNEYKLYLSNGKVIEFTFKPENIPHLLGVNIVNLKASNILLNDKPFEMLKELIDRYVTIYQKMTIGEVNYNAIFSPYIKEKLDFFKMIFKFNSSNILGVCHYLPARAYINGERNNYGCDYYIIFDDEENYPYFLGIKKDRNKYYYAPSSIIGTFDEQRSYNCFASITFNQQVMLVNNVCRINTGEKYYVTNTEKLTKVQKLRNLSQTYDFHLILDHDYVYNLRKMMASFEENTKLSKFLSNLNLAIVQRKQLRIDKDLDDSCKELAEAYNLQALSSFGNNSTIITELKKLKEELLQAKETIKSHEQTISSQQSIIANQNETIQLQEKELDNKDEEIRFLSQFKEEAFQLFKKYSN